MLRHGSLFSGIGGFDLAAEWMGWENVFHCEINPFGQKILKHYWPNAIQYDDITKTDFTIHRGTIDILTGGFPCQPFSLAGKRKGTADARNLWPEYYRAIKEIQPDFVVGENVYGIVNWNGGMVFEQVQADLENEGYQVAPVILPACSVGAPHRRDRIWFVAYSERNSNFRKERRSNDEKEGIQEQYKQEYSSTGESCGTNSYDVEGNEFNRYAAANTDGLRGSQEHELQQTKIHFKHGERRITANTNQFNGYISGLRTSEIPQQQTPKIFGNTITNSNIIERYEGRLYETESQTTERHISPFNSWHDWRAWQNFPTQSPLCSRNDGISTKLDGITFSKWRNESIKAYGNAIVPQVAFQIFKAIEKTIKN